MDGFVIACIKIIIPGALDAFLHLEPLCCHPVNGVITAEGVVTLGVGSIKYQEKN